MVIHSIVPPEIIFRDLSESKYQSMEMVDWKDVRLEVKRVDNRSVEINRIISTNPMNYLKPELQPGTIIDTSYLPKKP